MTPRRARLVLVLVVLGVVGVGVVVREPVSLWLLTVEVPYETTPNSREVSGQHVRGVKRVTRWGDPGQLHGPKVAWHVETGFLAHEEEHSFGRLIRATFWHPHGKVFFQLPEQPTKQVEPYSANDSPPWLWNVTDQTAPSMPAWMKDDEQWQRALDAQE